MSQLGARVRRSRVISGLLGAVQPPPAVRSVLAGAMGVAGAIFLAFWFSKSQPIRGWFFPDLATIWIWQIYLSAACLSVGSAVVTRLVPSPDRTHLETAALSFPAGLVVFVSGMYVGGFLRLFGPVFAVALPAVMLAAGAPRLRVAWSRARATGTLPALRLSGLPLVASLVGLLLIGVLYLGGMSPDAVNYDASWVHLVIAQDYAREGRIVPFPGDWQLNVPHFASVVYTWSFLVPGLRLPALRWMMALHTELQVVIWTLVGIAAAARWLAGREARATWTVLALFPALFVYDSNVGGAADHFAALFVAPVVFLSGAVWRRFDRGPCLLWGLLAGGAQLSKVQTTYVLGPLVLWLLVRAVILGVRSRRGDPAAPAPREILIGLGLIGAGVAVVFLPHLAGNWVFFRNPVYPLFQNVFTGSRPTVPGGAMQVANIMADWHFRPTGTVGQRLADALSMLFTFSFVPHYSFVNGLPMFGSVFTLGLPLLLVIGRAGRLWLAALTSLCALLLWALTYWVDRNLMILFPLLAATTAAILVRAWELGWVARIGISALVLIQVAWGSALVFSGSDRISGAVALLRSGMDGRAEAQLRSYRSEYVALGQSLPADAKLMMHNHHISLGIDRPVILDWFGFQGMIDYRTFRSPRDLHDRLRELGITHVTFVAGGHAASSLQEQIVFDVFIERYGRDRRQFGGFALFPLSPEPPPRESPYRVLLIGVPEHADGLYPIESLSSSTLVPPSMKTTPVPERTASVPLSLQGEAKVILAGGQALPGGGPEAERLSREFQEVPTASGLRLLVRR